MQQHHGQQGHSAVSAAAATPNLRRAIILNLRNLLHSATDAALLLYACMLLCAGALVISTPVASVAGLTRAAKKVRRLSTPHRAAVLQVPVRAVRGCQ
jgi:hypothetical protein